MTYQRKSPAEAHQALQQDPDLEVLDVRTEVEHRQHRIAGARLLPIQELEARLNDLDPDTAYLVTCEHGIRSVAACEFLTAMGFQKLFDLSGGMAQWIGEGLPVERS